MVTVKGSETQLQHAFRNAMKSSPHRAPVLVTYNFCAPESIEERIRSFHADLSNAKKTYFHIFISKDDGNFNLRCAIDQTYLSAIKSYISGHPPPFYQEYENSIDKVLHAVGIIMSGGAVKEADPQSITITPLTKIDGHFNGMYNDKALSGLFKVAPGLSPQRIGAIITERMQFAYKTLLSFITLTGVKKAETLSLAMVYSAFDMGFKFGFPVAPVERNVWKETFSIGGAFDKCVDDVCEYLTLDAYITTLFPSIGFIGQERLLSEHKHYLKNLRTGKLGDNMPKEILENLNMEPEAIDARVKKIGLIYD